MFSPMVRRRWFLVLLAFISFMTLSGCHPSQFKTNTAEVSQLVVVTGNDPKTFNYALIQESPNISNFTYEGLVTENGVTAAVEPDLAESWKISPDKLRFVFTLRQDLKWSDGEPLTADDVVFSFNDIYMNKRIPNYYKDGLQIGVSKAFPKVHKIDTRHVEFILPEPFSPFLRVIGETGILPKHALRQAVGTNRKDGQSQFLSTWGTDADPTKVVVNGPYKMESYVPTQRLIFRRNPYYWRKDAQGNQQPYIEQIIWEIVENVDTELIQFRSGGLDIVGIGPSSFQLLKREEQRGNFTIQNGGPDASTYFITFNLNKGSRNGRPLIDPIKSRWFNTVEFRQAIAYAINRQAMLNNISRGIGETQNSPISVQSPYYLSPKEGLKVYDYNPDKSKELLQKAGFKYDSQGQLLDADGNRVRFTLMASSGGKGLIESQLKQDLSKIGIQIDLQYLSFNILGEKQSNTLDWESYFGAITGGTEPAGGNNVWLPDGSYHVFNQKPQPGQSPIEGWEVSDWEKKIGQLYIAGSREFDETKRKAIYAETQRISQEYLPFIYLINPLDLAAVRNTIKGVKYTALGDYHWNIYELKVAKP